MQDGAPAAPRSRRDVFRAVINVDQVRATPSAHFFHRIVDGRVRFHRADFVGINVAIKVFEERKVSPDVFDGEVVGVGKNVGLETALTQFGVQCNRAGHFRKDVREITAELRQVAAKADRVADGVVKLLAREATGFVIHQQRRTAKKRVQRFRRDGTARSDFPFGDGVVEFHENFAEVEDEDGSIIHGRKKAQKAQKISGGCIAFFVTFALFCGQSIHLAAAFQRAI